MYKVNKQTKTLEKVSEASFDEIECKERKDLQEWIVSNPAILGEDLLIIQKEFADFDNTNERLDLLALDKTGKLVVIENKTDDTGKDVVWQAVKYASYCSTLSAVQVRDIYAKYITKNNLDLDAEKEILEFLGKDSFDSIEINSENSQRIILVSRKFRPEVLSAAQWLLNYGVGISCVQVMPLKYGDEIFLDSDQILPQAEMQEYTLKLANKAKEAQAQQKTLVKSQELRNAFWKDFIPKFSLQSSLFKNISCDRTDHWLGVAASMLSGITYNFLICKDYCGVEFGMANSDKDINKKVYDVLIAKKEQITKDMEGYDVVWERLDNSKMSRVIVRNEELSLYDTESWDEIEEYLSALMIRFEATFKKYAPLVKAAGK